MREWESYELLHSRTFYSPAPDFSPLPMATLNHALLHSIHRILLLSSSYRPGHSDLKARDLLLVLSDDVLSLLAVSAHPHAPCRPSCLNRCSCQRCGGAGS